MALKKLDDLETKKEKFIQGAKAESVTKSKPVQRISKKGKVDKPFTKQTINLDEKRYLKVTTHCKKKKISFQDFMVNLIDNFFSK
jgi:hypothetical protein